MPPGYSAEETTDPKGNVTTKVYDRAGRLLQVTADGGTITYSYYADGSRKSVLYPGGASEAYTYYPNGLLQTLTNKRANGSVMDLYSYTYDAAHNQLSKTETINGISKGTTNYTYDSLNRLESVTEPSGQVTEYTYDAAGNRLTETVTAGSDVTITTYSYNSQNRLSRTATAVNGSMTRDAIYTSDNNG